MQNYIYCWKANFKTHIFENPARHKGDMSNWSSNSKIVEGNRPPMQWETAECCMVLLNNNRWQQIYLINVYLYNNNYYLLLWDIVLVRLAFGLCFWWFFFPAVFLTFMRSFPSVDQAVPEVGAGFRASINFFTCLCCVSLDLDAQTWWSMLYCRYLSAKANSPLPAKTFTTSPNCCCVRLCSISTRSNSCCGFHPATSFITWLPDSELLFVQSGFVPCSHIGCITFFLSFGMMVACRYVWRTLSCTEAKISSHFWSNSCSWLVLQRPSSPKIMFKNLSRSDLDKPTLSCRWSLTLLRKWWAHNTWSA